MVHHGMTIQFSPVLHGLSPNLCYKILNSLLPQEAAEVYVQVFLSGADTKLVMHIWTSSVLTKEKSAKEGGTKKIPGWEDTEDVWDTKEVSQRARFQQSTLWFCGTELSGFFIGKIVWESTSKQTISTDSL